MMPTVAGAVRRGAESLVVTPLGLVSHTGLARLCAFGAQAERLEYPCIDIGGFIVPGRDPVASNQPGMESDRDAAAERTGEGQQSTPEEAGPPTGAWKRQPQAAPGSSPYAVWHELSSLQLDVSALVSFHPLTRVVASTETALYLNVPIGVIPDLPIGARLTLEVPLRARSHLATVPDVRAWAVWEGGPMHGRLIESHHQNPDRSICAHMPGEWILGVYPLNDFVAFCVLWAAKVLHELLAGFYPGPQHYPAAARVRRDRSDEFCGCGEHRRYRNCCRAEDRAQRPYELYRDAHVARVRYLNLLASQGRLTEPPMALLGLGLTP